MNRRDLLKYFTAGASIIPVVGGMPKMEAAANLIEVPKISPVEIVKDIPLLNSFRAIALDDIEISVTLKQRDFVYHIEGKSFVTRVSCPVIQDVTTHNSNGEWMPGYSMFDLGTWKLEGKMTGAMKCTLTTL
jgi:hypothetical protein